MNVIAILLDTLRRDHIGCYGNDWIKTPNINSFAERSTVFENHYIASHPCLPARRDIWTGCIEFPWRGWGPLEPDDVDFPGLIKNFNKTSMLVTDHYHLWERGGSNYHCNFTGVEFIRGQESDNWLTDPNVPIKYPAAREKIAGHARPTAFQTYSRNTSIRRGERDYFFPQVISRSIDWIDRNHTHEDFVLFIDSFDPHEPWDPPEHYWKSYNPGYQGEHVIWPSYGPANYLSDDELNQVRALYAGEVTMVDTWLGIFLDHVERLGLMKNTMIIITTDHGILLGEHGLIGKPWTKLLCDSNIYQELAHIPLIIYSPDGTPQRRTELVQPVDLFPTIMEAVGIEYPSSIHGKDLMPLLKEINNSWDRQFAIWGRFGESIAITDGEWLLIKWPDQKSNNPLFWYSHIPPAYPKMLSSIGKKGSDRYAVEVERGIQETSLFNLIEDYAQEHNIASKHPEIVEYLSRALVDQLLQIGAPTEHFERLDLDKYLK